MFDLLGKFAGFANASSCAVTAYKFNAFISRGKSFMTCRQIFPSNSSHPYLQRLGSIGAGSAICLYTIPKQLVRGPQIFKMVL